MIVRDHTEENPQARETERILKSRVREDYLSKFGGNLPVNGEMEIGVLQVLERFMGKKNGMSDDDKRRIVRDVVNDVRGLGPIEDLMQDPTVTEIMINGHDRVYIEREGKTVLTDIVFDDDQHLRRLINKILSSTRRHVDESSAYVDISLKDGSRVNIIIPPLALNGPVVTIRKFLKEIRSMEDLLEKGTMDSRMADLLMAAISAKLNIIFSGASGSGKTTTLNVLASCIDDERIVAIEDTAELVLTQDHVVRLETKQPTIEGKGEVTIRDLFKNSLRMRAERVIVGEVRGEEALDMLQAMCAGQNGTLAIIHASCPRSVVYRIETMILSAFPNMTAQMVHRQIGAAVHLIVHQEQMSDGSRRIANITQIRETENGDVQLEDIFTYDLEGTGPKGEVKGKWRATGIVPFFYPLMVKSGIGLSEDIFTRD